ncbi:MAG: thiamine pyrophosphate-dependent dehydrogenase E1 component subunit alpha, partial [Longimicrobiales bacterium]
GQDRVALTYIGDGGASTGAFHEGLNLAAVQRAPLVLIVENNGYAYSTPVRRQTAAESFVVRARAYGIHGERCDGNDVVAVYEATRAAADRARRGEGAALIEVMTYRRKGHAEHDGQEYVPEAELREWETRDPVSRFETLLLESDTATQDQLDATAERVTAEVDEARVAAEASPLPEPAKALTGVWGGIATRPPWTRRDPVDPHEA